MAVRVAKFREQPWGSELSQRAVPNDEPLKDKNVLAVLEQLTALADTASSYFSASCRRVSCGAASDLSACAAADPTCMVAG
jgi:succinate dehydrogenase/fumarate reductase-like Fe-S protein